MSKHHDSIGPDPYAVKEGFKKLPEYECRLCGENTSSDKEAQHFNDGLGVYDDFQPICFRCAKLVEIDPDWRVW